MFYFKKISSKELVTKLMLLIISSLLFAACSGFLEENPESEMVVDDFFTSALHANNAVNILYRSGCVSFYSIEVYGGSRMMLGNYMSGLFDNDYKGQELHVQYCQNLTLNGHNLAGYFEEAWDACYDAISKANFAISNIALMPELSMTQKNLLLAQAKYFRAINYFYLVKTFGDVPLILKNYSTLENMYVKRTPSLMVYNQIVEDLKFALEQGGLNDLPMPKNEFRISKGSAAALLADVYLNMSGFPVKQEKYLEAANLTKSIINSGNYSLIANGTTEKTSAYNRIRLSDIEDEYLYVVEYDADIESNHALPAICYPSEATSWGIFKYSVINNAFKPTNELMKFYDQEKDLRIQEKQFFHSSLTYEKNGNQITKDFETAPYLWHDDVALFETGKTSKDIAVYRYAEILLIAAEAIVQTEGVTPEAISYLVDVRSRAYWQTDRSEIVDQVSNLSADAFIQELWKERIRELALDNKMWSDIQRTRKFPVAKDGISGGLSFVEVIGHTTIWGKTFEEKHLLFPITENEIQRNPNLVQNPGY